MLAQPMSEEEIEALKKKLSELPCRFDVLITEPCQLIKFAEIYSGPCPWCGVETYTKDVCQHCGEEVGLS